MLVVRRDFLSQGKPATGKRPEGVLGGCGGRVERARSEGGAAREQTVIGEGVEGFSQVGWRIHDDLLQRDHRRGACFPGRIPRDLELPDHLDDTVPGFGGRGRLARQHGPGGALGIDGVGLADGAARVPVPPIHFGGISSKLHNVLADPIDAADYVVMCNSFYHFVDIRDDLLRRMKGAARKAVILTEPVRNVSAHSFSPWAGFAKWLTNPGVGDHTQRFDRASFRAFAEEHDASEFIYEDGNRNALAVFYR